MSARSFDRLADRLTDLVDVRVERVAPRIERGHVVQVNPLAVDLGDDVLIEEGDPDVEFDRALLRRRPAIGEAVRVEFADGDWIVCGIVDGDGEGVEPDPVIDVSALAVLREAAPSVEYPEFAQLAVGGDWTPAFEAVRDYVGQGGAFRAEHRVYVLNNFVMLPQQQLVGQGQARTILRAAASAVRVIDLPGVIRHSKLKALRIEGNGESEGSRLQALNGDGGATSQDASFEDVEWWQCTVGQRVAGTGPVPQSGQADKTRYNGCTMYQCNIGLQCDAINSQEQLWDGGEISDPIGPDKICVLLNGGGFTGISMQFQSTIRGTGTCIVFGGANVHQVLLMDIITEGFLTGIDSGAGNLWPLQGVTIINSTMQVHEPSEGDLIVVDRGGSIAGLVAIHSSINGGPVRLRGNDTYFEDIHCGYNRDGGTAGRVIVEGINARHLPRSGAYVQVVAASTIAAPPGAELIAVFPGPTINTITGGWDGREIRLSFVGAATVGSGTGNIALAGGAAFPGTAADTLTLVSEGGVWREAGRSVN